MDFVEHRGCGRYCACIDARAVATALDPALICTHHVRVDGETVSPLALGMAVVERRVHHAWHNLPAIGAACDADFGRFRALLVRTLTSPGPHAGPSARSACPGGSGAAGPVRRALQPALCLVIADVLSPPCYAGSGGAPGS